MTSAKPNLSHDARTLWRSQTTASLGTLQGDTGWPYTSFVLIACDHDGALLLLLSNLAEHTKNLQRDPRASLLVDGTIGLTDRLTGARVTLLGQMERSPDPRHRARFLSRHPSAATYIDFADFAIYRFVPARAHLVAGFGRIHWIEQDLLCPMAPDLVTAESGIVDHMNQDHTDTIQLYAERLLSETGKKWYMTGIDPEGCDLAREGKVARLAFSQRIETAEAARVELIRLVKLARSQDTHLNP